MKDLFKDWTLFEKILYFSSVIITTVISVATGSTLPAIINGFCNMTNAILSAKGRISNYYFGIVGNIIYIWLSFQARYYSEVITCLLIVIPIMIYGLISWQKNSRNEQDVTVNRLSFRQIAVPIASQIIMAVPYYFILKRFNTELLAVSTFGMIVTILAFYFMAKADPIFNYFFIINAVTRMVMWCVPILQGSFSNVPLFLSNAVYFINDVYSLINWQKIARQQ